MVVPPTDAFEHPAGGYVFVVTYGRSGSTLLQNLLNTLPGYQIRGENNNALFALFQSWRAVVYSADITRMRSGQERSDARHPWFGAENIDADTYRAALCRTFAQAILQPAPGVVVGGFKEIRTIPDNARFKEYLEFMKHGFPQARFVFNTRNHDAVVRSSWWQKHDPDQVRKMMRAAEQVFRDFTAENPERAVGVHYDEYVADQAAFAPLFDLLQTRPTEAALNRVMATRLTHAT